MYILLSSILLLFVIAHQAMSFSLNKQYNKNSVFTAVNAMLCMIVLDRLIKYWTITEIAPLKKGIELINGVFRFSYVENRGARKLNKASREFFRRFLCCGKFRRE